MATLTILPVTSVAGGTVVPLVAASAGGDRVQPGSRVFLMVRNGSGASINVTLDTTGVAFNSQLIPDTVVAVAAGATAFIPITSDYQSAVDGLASIAYSAVTTVTVAAVSFP